MSADRQEIRDELRAAFKASSHSLPTPEEVAYELDLVSRAYYMQMADGIYTAPYLRPKPYVYEPVKPIKQPDPDLTYWIKRGVTLRDLVEMRRRLAWLGVRSAHPAFVDPGVA